MRTFTLASLKGGTGKTTLAAALAVEAERQGERVAIIDTDAQGSLAEWFNARAAETPSYARVTLADLPSATQRLREAGFTVAIIDTPANDRSALRAALGVSDAALIPVRPSPNDLRAAGDTLAEVKAAALPFAFVLSQRVARTAIAEQALIALGNLAMVAPAIIGSRTAYAAAMVDGRTAPEIEPRAPSAAEIADLWAFARTLPEKAS